MKTCTIIASLLLCCGCSTVSAQQAPRGATEGPTVRQSFICVGQAEQAEAPAATGAAAVPHGSDASDSAGTLAGSDASGSAGTSAGSDASGRGSVSSAEEWRAVDSVVFDAYVPALGYAGIRFDHAARCIELVTNLPALTTAARAAVDRSPVWLRHDLRHTLGFLSNALQDDLAGVISAAPERMIDEVSFAIAHSSPAFLSSAYYTAQLFRENAESIYANDTVLSYVDVVDYGSPASGDYWSTVRYWRIDKDSNRVQVEVPRDIYYWYIVHPKITDEVSAYIDPWAADGLAAVAAPPTGRFWRDYLFTVTERVPDTTDIYYPILREQVKDCSVLWADRGAEKGAVLAIGKWVRDVLDFGSKTERPHQPVRIYSLHLGRCGEHADFTAAAARACLIPCREISAISSDHVWNEFWDEQWWQWEPVNNSQKNPLVYSAGWGKKFGSVFAHRSDGALLPVTDTYAKATCTLDVTVKDAANAPVDGAMVMIAMRVDQSIFVDTYGATGSDGIAHFIVGKENDYFARFDSPNAGSFPATANQVTALMTDADSGRHYAYQLKSTTAKPQLVMQAGTISVMDTISDFAVSMDAVVVDQASRWQQPMDDIASVAPSVFYQEGSQGSADAVFIHRDQYPLLRDRKPYTGSGGPVDMHGSFFTTAWTVDGTGDFYWLLINDDNANNPVRVSATMRLYFSSLLNDAEPAATAAEFSILGCYPSPVTGDGAILVFEVTDRAGTQFTMDLHDLLGRKVRTQEMTLSGTGKQVARLGTLGLQHGCYLLRVLGANGCQAQRMIQVQ